MSGSRLNKLSRFVKTLENIDFKFNVNLFNHRLKLQKLVYLARRYGIDLGYSYNLYLHGPYSPELADDYYRLPEATGEIELPNEFSRLVKYEPEWWLELAATLVMARERYPPMRDDRLIELIVRDKSVNEGKLRSILEKLKRHNAI